MLQTHINIKDIYEQDIQDFPDIANDYFQLKDKNVIENLNNLYKNSVQIQNPIQSLGGNEQEQKEYRIRQNKLLEVFDTIGDKMQEEKGFLQQKTPFTHFDYYDLANVQYDDLNAVSEGYQFLSQLEGQKTVQSISQDLSHLSLDYKPKYKSQGKQKIIQEDIPVKKLSKKMNLLSFEEEEMNEYI